METSLEVKVIVNQVTTINPFLGYHESDNDNKTEKFIFFRSFNPYTAKRPIFTFFKYYLICTISNHFLLLLEARNKRI